MGSSYLRYAMALRERLPEVGKAFRAGDIDYRAFQTVVFRTDLITDPDMLARVDARLAARLSLRPSLTRGRLAAEVDRIVAKADRDAVRRAKESLRDRFVDVVSAETGVAFVSGTVRAPAGRASTSDWMSWRERYATRTRARASSDERTRWARWPSARSDSCAAVDPPTARARHGCAKATLSSMWSPTSPPSTAAAPRPA